MQPDTLSLKGKTFIHVVESCSGGTLTAIQQLIRCQSELGAKTELFYLKRIDSPSEESLRNMLPAETEINCLGHSSILGLMRMTKALIVQYRYLNSDRIYHLHSSWAGLIGKIVLGRTSRANLHFTPHGFSFIRTDINAFQRKLFKAIETVTNLFSRVRIISTSAYEDKLALQVWAKDRSILTNAVDTSELLAIRRHFYIEERSAKFVGTLARITSAKNPDRFLRATNCQCGSVIWKWIGDGDRELFNNHSSPHIQITGWLNRIEALEQLATLDVFVLLSDWESYPFSLIEAQSMGIPCVIWNFPSSNELVTSGIDGFIVSTLEELCQVINLILWDSNLYKSISHASLEKAAKVYSLGAFIPRMLFAYKLK